eukprot:jgi/Mesen1/6046/ME000308S05239
MSVVASSRPATGTSLPQAEINWDRLDKTKFFVVGTGLFTGVTTALFPFSVIKTRLQVATSAAGSTSAFATARNIARYEGVRGFYRGFGTVIAGTIPGRCVYLSTLEMTKSSVLAFTSSLGLSETMAAGLASGAGGALGSMATQLVVVPVDVAFPVLHGLCQSSLGVTAAHSIALGYGPEAEGKAPPSGALLMLVQALGGTTAGGVAAFVTTPLDTVMESVGDSRPRVSQVVRELYAREGVKGFYRGLGPRWASMALWGTCMITTYEFLKRLSVKEEV